MKKIIILCCSFLLLNSCAQSRSDIDAAKQKILTEKPQIIQEEEIKIVEREDDINTWNIQIVSMDANSPLNFDPISEVSFQSGEVVMSGHASQDVDKIEVFFSNVASKYPDDRYILQTYEAGDESFRYVASSRNQVLDFGKNEYIFRAYSGISENETKIILTLPYEEKEKIGTESQLIGTEDNTILIDLPTSSRYGEPMKLGEASFTYTQIKWLEIEKEIFTSVSCETLTDFLTEKMNTWYYWNTCREIVKDKGIKFNVISLDGEQYIYERHYIDFEHGFYGTYELEKGLDVNSENIAQKNTELKDQEFPSLEIVDGLIEDIVNS